jgi:DNA-binding LacI/PurR family transcriptional regulator
MHFLQKHKVRVPDKLSLISFDDGDIALRNRITSYNFNVEAYVNSALEYVIRPLFWAQTWKGKASHIAGTIVERDSTAAV